MKIPTGASGWIAIRFGCRPCIADLVRTESVRDMGACGGNKAALNEYGAARRCGSAYLSGTPKAALTAKAKIWCRISPYTDHPRNDTSQVNQAPVSHLRLNPKITFP